MFFNSLRLAWQMSLWADSAVLLRTMAWLDVPTEIHLLAPLMPRQMELDLSGGSHNCMASGVGHSRSETIFHSCGCGGNFNGLTMLFGT